MECITYKEGYKYQLHEAYTVNIGDTMKPPHDITTDYIDFFESGELVIKKGYAWDGPSGPTFDTKNFMRGSLVHDALYQLMREDKLSTDTYRNPADQLIRIMCREDGMSRFRARMVYIAVHRFGGPSSRSRNAKKKIKAPKGC